MRTRTTFVLFAGAALLGCSALIGVRDDVFFDENAEGGASSSSGTASSSGTTSSSGGTGDGGTDGAITCNDDLQTSKEHCGRCGHSCGGGECTAGKCQPIQIGAVADAPLEYIEVGGDYVYVASTLAFTTQTGGVWRVPRNGGAAQLYAGLRYAENMKVVNDRLFFVVNDDPGDGGDGQTGGLYVCPTTGTAPCQPSRIVAADTPRTIWADGTRIVFTDRTIGMRAYDTVGASTTTLNDFTAGHFIYVDGTAAFYNVTIANSQPYSARTIEIYPDGGYAPIHNYTKDNASTGNLVGTKDALYIAAYDFSGTNGGVLHRYPRNGGLPCDYGGNTNKRPYGITIDATRIYWTNLGDGADEPFTAGSVATCDLAGCCTTPETLWTGDGMPAGIANDDAFIYWVVGGTGAIWKLAKP